MRLLLKRAELVVGEKLTQMSILRIKVQSIQPIKMMASLCLVMLIGLLSIQSVKAAADTEINLPGSPRLLALVDELVTEQGFDRTELT